MTRDTVFEHILFRYLCLLQEIEDARESGDWSEVSASGEFFRDELRRHILEILKTFAGDANSDELSPELQTVLRDIAAIDPDTAIPPQDAK